jgi:CubicO group peptidase (beta-lactamase class C family)
MKYVIEKVRLITPNQITSTYSVELIQGLKYSHPLSAPFLRPSYSSYAFAFLGYAMQSVTGKNYSQLLRNELSIPLRLEKTGPSPGIDSEAVIPPTDNAWGGEFGEGVP